MNPVTDMVSVVSVPANSLSSSTQDSAPTGMSMAAPPRPGLLSQSSSSSNNNNNCHMFTVSSASGDLNDVDNEVIIQNVSTDAAPVTITLSSSESATRKRGSGIHSPLRLHSLL